MGKSKRGGNIKKTPNWRGVCPLCNRTGVKLLWDKVMDGDSIKICKSCSTK